MPLPGYQIPILMYHNIDENDTVSKLSVSPHSLEKQIAFLIKKKYDIISLLELITTENGIQRKKVSITFDDGFVNNYRCVLPIVKKFNIPAAIFIITDRVGTERYVSWDEIREMAAHGISIGSHTKTHRPLTDVSEVEAREEIIGSKKILEDTLGMDIDLFSYPLGAFNDEILNIVRRAGYVCACATNPPKKYFDTDPFTLRRIKVTPTSDNLFLFSMKVSGYYTLFR